MRQFLDDFEAAKPWLTAVGFADPVAAHRNFVAIAERGIPFDLLISFRDGIAKYLPSLADADRALNNFERMLAKVRSPLSMMTFLHRKPNSLAVLLQLFAASQYFSDLIIESPEYFDFLWEEGQTALDPQALKDEILAEMRPGGDEERFMNQLRRHRQRELLRIGYRDIVVGEPLERITESISDLADCLADVALTVAHRKRAGKHGEPRTADGRLSRVVILAMGKLGGRELNYSSDIDLMVVYEEDGQTDGKASIAVERFYTLVVQDVVRYLSARTARGQAYRVDLRLRPHGQQAPLSLALARCLDYYEQHGRTWERQALVKVRPIAGSLELGHAFVAAIDPFIYRRYLSFVEINEIKTIKRQIERKTAKAGGDTTDLKTGHGGIRDIEFVIQFLQLLHGGAVPEVCEPNTLKALKRLAAFGCINQDEHAALETAYRFLRKAEHRLQFMFDLQTHRIPEQPDELRKLALRLGYLPDAAQGPAAQFLADLRTITERNRRMLNRLMHDLFSDEEAATPGEGEPESDLLLDPQPEPERIREVLGRFPFTDVETAFKNLTKLAHEEVPFLSSVRCRHFLASIAPRLLRAISETPDPDRALTNLEKVTASLGAKGVLWESFSVNPALSRLYVDLCAWSQFLSDILVNNPGMIDELLDSLVMNRPQTLADFQAELGALLRGAREVDPILHSFKNTRLLAIGVHDILGRSTLPQTTRSLAELAEAIVGAVIKLHWDQLAAIYGVPALDGDPARPAAFVLLGLGKFGGKELGYHSDLDLFFVYEGDGRTVPAGAPPTRGSVTNLEFFTELAQRFLKTTSRLGPLGRLYPVDFRLRPMGRSGILVSVLEQFESYYLGTRAAFWERQALTRARTVLGAERFAQRVRSTLQRALCEFTWKPEFVDEIESMRRRLEASRSAKDLKRGAGGIVDVEFAVQLIQLKYGRQHPQILEPNIWDALQRLRELKLWEPQPLRVLYEGYTFLRSVESRLRIVYDSSRDELPEDPVELDKLAHRLGYEGHQAGQRLLTDIERHTQAIRDQFLARLDYERRNGVALNEGTQRP